MIFSYLSWDKIEGLPFSSEAKPLAAALDWSQNYWTGFGLPIPFAKYIIDEGGFLYLEALPDGTQKIEKSDFTGEIFTNAYLLNGNGIGDNFFVSFAVLLYKGEVKEVRLDKEVRQTSQERKTLLDNMNTQVNKKIRVTTSWWFRYLYRPWSFCVRVVCFLLTLPLVFFNWIITLACSKLTPYG